MKLCGIINKLNIKISKHKLFRLAQEAKMELSNPTVIKSILARYGLRISKSLGQNFIVDPLVCPRMAEECGAGPHIGALEIGPGLGVLTDSLSRRAEKVVSVELDKQLLPILKETLFGLNNVDIVQGDALKIDIKQLISDKFGSMETIVCANLPYYITTPIIMRFLEEHIPVSSITAMVQEEAANRLCAEPGNRACGAVSAAVHYYCVPQILFKVPRTCFYPQPSVDSAVIKLNILKRPPVKVADEKFFFSVIKSAFCQRRKTILNSISGGLHIDKKPLSDALDNAGIKSGLRAEQLTIKDFAALSNALYENRRLKNE